ncbi:MAG: hypothetical protein IT375_16790 [Polyangiaceae bacterium]|nr:hypothetical protein [Polyangiaceae bacterium]
MLRFTRAFAFGWIVLGCGGSTDTEAAGGTGGSAGAASGGSAGTAAGGSGGSATGGAAGAPTGGAAGTPSGGASSGGAGGGGPVADPSKPGTNGGTPFDGTASVAATKHQVPMHCVLPVGSSSATAPVILIGHGFQLPAKQYNGYADRLASHGFIACTVDFPAGFSPNHAGNAQDMVGALDWVLVQSASGGSPLQGKVDINQIGVMGHSLGGKVSVLAAKTDARFKAVLGLDPVDAATGCTDKTLCPDASDSLPLPIPTAFLGETLDATGSFQACAPAADNYQTFFAKAGAPSVEVTLNGANHMSFIDDLASCGLTCNFCQKATLPSADALDIARAYSVAFFARHLRGQTGYDAWLTGDLAKQKWGAKISLQSK